MLLSAEHGVFFGGAGVSTDSGLADFRSAKGGLYNQPSGYGVSPEEILTPVFYEAHRGIFRLLPYQAAQPRRAAQQHPPHPRGAGGAGAHKVRHHPERGQPAPARWEPERHRHPRQRLHQHLPRLRKALSARGGGRLRGSAPLRRVRRHHPPRHPALRRDPGHAPHHGSHPRAQKRGPANNRRHLPQSQQRAAPARPLPRAHGHNKRRAHAL